MSNFLAAMLTELRPELVQLVREAVETAFAEKAKQPRYPEMVSVDVASEITSYSKNSLYQMHSKGQVPGAVKVGGKLLFETAALQNWVKQGGRV